MKKISFLYILLAGCGISDNGIVGAGSANYEYSRTLTDGSTCSVNVLTGRDVVGGALQIDKDCGVTSSVESTKGVNEALKTVNSAISAAREAISKVP